METFFVIGGLVIVVCCISAMMVELVYGYYMRPIIFETVTKIIGVATGIYFIILTIHLALLFLGKIA